MPKARPDGGGGTIVRATEDNNAIDEDTSQNRADLSLLSWRCDNIGGLRKINELTEL